MSDAGGQGERYDWLAEALRDDGIVLTASRRLARELHSAFNERQLATGAIAWPTPPIEYWRDWTGDLLIETADVGPQRSINASASAVLWERSVRRHLDTDVLGTARLVRQASAAWQRLIEWQVPLAAVAAAARGRDERSFSQAAEDYSRVLTEHAWTDPAQAPAIAVERLAAGFGSVPRRVRLAGFDRITPLVAALQRALEERGSVVAAQAGAARCAAADVASFADVEAELRAAGRWARDVLIREPGARVAVVAADLDTQATRYTRLIREGVAPGWQTGTAAHAHAVNVSYGRPVADFPAITVALLCLRWAARGLTSGDVSVLLRSPLIGGEEPAARARLDRRLRDLPDRQWSPAALADALEHHGGETLAPEWLANVRRLAALRQSASARQAPSAWVERFDAMLNSIGWPGPGSLASDEFQLINRWRELLNELAALGLVAPELTLGEAFGRLSALAREAIYQPEQGPGLVQLLGALEAAGMEFDHLWMTGMDAGRWPPAGNPLALVSRGLQREHGMPDATPVDTLDYARRVVDRLAASAPVVRFSWARSERDTVQTLSPLLAQKQDAHGREDEDPGWYAATHIGRAGVQICDRDPVPPVAADERVAGGAGTVGLQWQEPFAAFAGGRLGVRELARFQAGLTASLRGSLLHAALHELYRDTPPQSTIRGWSAAEREQRIDRAVDRALASSERHADAVLRRLLALERRRMRLLIRDFLDHETRRQPFTIDRVEQRIDFVHAGVHLELRADRIDRLHDGTLLIIDYKTGMPKNLLGQDGDPVEPQVVVYAAALDETIGGLMLLNINRRAIQYKGAGSSTEWGTVAADEWHASLARWKAQVLSAIEAIASGDVRVNLRRGAGERWQLDVLSRIEEERRVP